ncbi:yvrE [Symbiodinium pilosum]|uniref:YvrE protein n=1 Tax=Symbiodinium pilosum TaxID=2952 RepID=A0A812X7K0_SYMPI|nr:yvrE [Symbiodinium pilosum]
MSPVSELSASSADSVLQSLRETLHRTQISAADLLRPFGADKVSDSVSEADFRAGLVKLGFQLSNEQFLAVYEKVDKDAAGNVLLSNLERRLTRTGTKQRHRSKQSATAEERMAPHLPSLGSLGTPAEVSSANTSKLSTPDWLAGNDRHGAVTARERRMASNRRKPAELSPLSDSDFVLVKIQGMLNRRKVRSMDVFKFLDLGGDGSVSREELCNGLERLGVGKLSESERRDLFSTLDIDGSGSISLAELKKSLKQAERKARSQGKEELIDTWKVPAELQMDVSTSTTTDWSKRTLKFDGEFIADEGGARGASKCLTSRDISQSRDLDISKSLDCELAPVDLEGANETGSPKRFLNASSSSWLQASAGPLRAALAAPLGCGNLHDNYILRQRLVSNTWASRPPSLETERLPLYKHGQFRRAIAETRWGAEVVGLPDERMRITRDGCLTASRPRGQLLMDRGREKFHAPLLQSVVDSVVFGRDLDFSGSQDYDDAFKVKFRGAYGKPSWFAEEREKMGPNNLAPTTRQSIQPV